MVKLRAFCIIGAVLLTMVCSFAQSLIGSADAVHLVEHKIRELNGGRFKATSVTYEEEKCTVLGTNGVYNVEAFLNARAARVLELRRDGQTFYTWEGVKVIGHRGNVKFAPENTIPALLEAIKLGVDLVEIDVRQTQDGELILMHDETVDRTTNGSGDVANLTLADIKALDAGSWFSENFKGVRAPTLREALAAIRGRALPDVDFKAGDPEKLIAILAEENLLGKITLYCGDWELMQHTLSLAPEGFLLRPSVPGGMQGLPIVLQKFDPQIVNINWKEFSEVLVQAVHTAGKKSFLNSMQQDTDYVRSLMISTLPDYLQSDHIDLMMPLLREQGLHK